MMLSEYFKDLGESQGLRLILSALHDARQEVYSALDPEHQLDIDDGWNSLSYGYSDKDVHKLVLFFLQKLEQEVLAKNSEDRYVENFVDGFPLLDLDPCITPDNPLITIDYDVEICKHWCNKIIFYIDNKVREKKFRFCDHIVMIEEDEIKEKFGEDYDNIDPYIIKAIYGIIKKHYENCGRAVKIVEPAAADEFYTGNGYVIYLNMPAEHFERKKAEGNNQSAS